MVPLTVACAVFSSDIVRVLLGEKWADAVPVFTRLSPTMLVLAIINPLSWLMLATGRATRSLCIALLIAPTVIVGYSLGLPSGPSGVAVGFSAAMLLLAAPVVIWSRQGTQVTGRDIARELMPVLVAAVIAGVVAFASSVYTSVLQSPVVRLTVNTSVLFGVFAVMMLFTMKDKSVYLKMLSDLNPHWRLSDRLQIRRLFQ
jgi:PST family polysaccharide transporter